MKAYRMTLILAVFLFIFTAIIAGSVNAAGASLRINPKKVNVGIITARDYEAGFVEDIRANLLLIRDKYNDWKIMVRTNDDDMGVVGGYIKPVSDLEWRSSGDYATQLTYTGITTYDVEVGRGPSGNRKQKIFVDYRVLLSWAKDVPGDYYLTLLYTLTTQ